MASDSSSKPPFKPALYDRLLSIAEDVALVRSVAATYPELALVPNLRCGEWYAPPSLTAERAYFKSTDGHTGEWQFNLRRANMHLVPLIQARGGLIIVDATRRGKRFPDALSKTVPLWCATLNRAVALRRLRVAAAAPAAVTSSDPPATAPVDSDEEAEASELLQRLWGGEVIVPLQSVGPSEKDDIERRVDGWAEKLLASSLPLPDLAVPLMPIHLSPSASLPHLPQTPGYHPILCLSASLYIVSDDERQRSGAWRYEQGAGDDHELWSAGLEAEGFWKLMEREPGWDGKGRDEVERLVGEVVSRAKETHKADDDEAQQVDDDLAVVLPTSRLKLGTLPLLPSTLAENACIAISPPSSPMAAPPTSNLLNVPLGPPKSPLPPRAALHNAIAFAASALARGQDVVVACARGTDASVGVGMVLLQALFDGDGNALALPCLDGATKPSLSTRLQWIINCRSRANPSRKTLQKVNELFMSRAHRPSTVVEPGVLASQTGQPQP